MLPWMATGAVPVRIRTATHFSLENSHRETSHRGRTFRSPWAFVASSLTLKLSVSTASLRSGSWNYPRYFRGWQVPLPRSRLLRSYGYRPRYVTGHCLHEYRKDEWSSLRNHRSLRMCILPWAWCRSNWGSLSKSHHKRSDLWADSQAPVWHSPENPFWLLPRRYYNLPHKVPSAQS